MKNKCIRCGVIILLLSLSFALNSQTIERIYISTDKDSYIAGNTLFGSLFCFDFSSQTASLSRLSSVAYVEMHSLSGLVNTAKVELRDGVGGFSFDISPSLATGNYRVIAYTQYERNERDFNPSGGAKEISVYNVMTTERVTGGVEVVDQRTFEKKKIENHDLIAIHTSGSQSGASGRGYIEIRNRSESDMILSLSVFNDQLEGSVSNSSIYDFVERERENSRSVRFGEIEHLPEIEGEIIEARVEVGGSAASLVDSRAYLSVIGDISSFYSSSVDSSGKVSFVTSNIFGEKDVVLEAASKMEIVSRFVNIPQKDIPVLQIDPSMTDMLEERGVRMQIERRFQDNIFLDTLNRNGVGLKFGKPSVTYRLDDYTRFESVEETIREFIPEVRTRRSGNNREMQVRCIVNYNISKFSETPPLLLLDGVQLTNSRQILDYDPTLIEEIRIYTSRYVFDGVVYDGIINFLTFKKNAQSLKLEGNSKIVKYDGMNYTVTKNQGEDVDENYPDYRETLFWNPSMKLRAGNTERIEVVYPIYEGNFSIVVEGVTATGIPVYYKLNNF